MATCLEIITGALVELGARAIGEDIDSAEASRALIVLQGMYRNAVESGTFGRLEDYLATANYTAEEGQRVYSAGYTITIPTTIADEDDGTDRRPRDLSMIQVVNASADPQISVYDAHAAAWVRLDNLTLTGDAPFSGRNRHGLECALARRLAGSFQRPIPESASAYANGLSSVLNLRLSAPRTAADIDFY